MAKNPTRDDMRRMAEILTTRAMEKCVFTDRLVAVSTRAIQNSRELLERAKTWMEQVNRRGTN